MEETKEHEFPIEHEEVFITLSESLYRFGLMFAVLGLGVIALGVTFGLKGTYGGLIAASAMGVAGLMAAVGGSMFVKARAGFDRIARTRGRDITRLIEGVDSLIRAHHSLRLMLLIFVLTRAAALIATRMN